MRRQDEIRLLFSGQEPASQKFLLSELDRFSQAFDADEVLDLLRSQIGQPAEDVRRQALVTSTLFLPGFTRRRYGMVKEQVGVWSQFHADQSLLAAADLAPSTGMSRAHLRDAALEHLAPLASTLAERLPSMPEKARAVAHQALALAPGGSDALSQWLGKSPRSFGLVWAWAAGGGGTNDPARLVSLLDRHGPGQPDLLLAAQVLPASCVSDLVKRLAGRVDWRGTAHLAMAIGFTASSTGLEDLASLAATPTGWGDVYLLRALEAMRRPEGLDLLIHIHGRTRHEFVRRQAVRSAGGFSSEKAIQFCTSQLDSKDGTAVAQALESLVRLRCPKSELAALGKKFADSDDLRTRVNGLLASTSPGEGRFPQAFLTLVRHVEVLPRIEAAFCLGYWPTLASLQLLETLATVDSSPHVRMQAIKSLSKFGALAALPVLTRLVEKSDPIEALTAARVMARLGVVDVQGLSGFFARELAQNTEPRRRALLLTAFGGLAAQGRNAAVETLFARALEIDQPEIQAATLEGWKLLGGSTQTDVLARLGALAKAGAPGNSTSAMVVQFLSGEITVVSRLCDTLRSTDEKVLVGAAQAALELYLLCSQVIGPEHTALARAFPARSGSSSVHTASWVTALRPVGPSLEEGEFDIRTVVEEQVAYTKRSTVPVDGATLVDRPPAPLVSPSAVATTEPSVASLPRLSAPITPYRDPSPSVQRDLKELLAEISERKTDRRVAGRGDLRQALQKATYLVDISERAGELVRESIQARALRAMRQGVAFFKQNPVLMLPLVGFTLVALVMMREVTAPAGLLPPPPPPVALTVMGTSGTLGLVDSASGSPTSQGEPVVSLQTGDVVRVGQSIRLSAGAESTLVTELGDRVRLMDAASMKVVESGEPGGLVLEPGPGTFDCVFEGGRGVTLKKGDRALVGHGAQFKAEVREDGWTVVPRTDGLDTIQSDGTRRRLAPERQHVIR